MKGFQSYYFLSICMLWCVSVVKKSANEPHHPISEEFKVPFQKYLVLLVINVKGIESIERYWTVQFNIDNE